MDDRPTAAVAPTLARHTAEQLLHRRILLLDSPLDDENASQLCVQLALLSAEDPRTDIALWIHSPGGSVSGMLAIADMMRLVPNDIRTVALGMAYSAGQFLLCCGTLGKRFALPHAKVLLHQGSAGIGGYAPDVELQADDLRQVRDTVLGIIAERTGQSTERIFEDSLRDRTFTASEAVDYGFVDEVVNDLNRIWPGAAGATGFSGTAAHVVAGAR